MPMRRVGAVAAALLLFAGSAAAEGQRTFTQWDRSRDGKLTEAEFLEGARSARWFKARDGNGDGRIGADELARIGFDADLHDWDADGDGYLTRDELLRGIYRKYDQDDDGTWTVGEWADVQDQP